MIELKTSKEALEFQVATLTEAWKKRIEDGGVGLDLEAKLIILHDTLQAHKMREVLNEIMALKPYWKHAQNCNLEEIQTIIKKGLGE